MKITTNKVIEAAQTKADILELGGDAVHVGYCAALDAEVPHLATADGNVPIAEGSWLVKEDGAMRVVSDTDFRMAHKV